MWLLDFAPNFEVSHEYLFLRPKCDLSLLTTTHHDQNVVNMNKKLSTPDNTAEAQLVTYLMYLIK